MILSVIPDAFFWGPYIFSARIFNTPHCRQLLSFALRLSFCYSLHCVHTPRPYKQNYMYTGWLLATAAIVKVGFVRIQHHRISNFC